MVVAVAVCARAGSHTLGLCVDALRAQGVDPLIVDVPRGQGLATARNDALATTNADVLAFVDDDVAVGDRWFDALRRAWGDAPEDRGCIGGPIAARFVGPRPPWLTDALLGVLGVGTGDTFHGGNVSFRADALRGIGGFWPVRGRPELRDWFSEEHHAQRELAAAGWSHACEPAAAAWRIVDPAQLRRGDVLALRLRYGARSALIGERRPRSVAARTAASSAAGVAVALATRDEARATERAARVAENAGVAFARLIAHRDLQPVSAETPFRYSVPAPQRLIRGRRGRSGPLVLLYHRVDDKTGAVTPANFASQIEVLLARSTPAPLPAIIDGDAPADAFAVTFDDGYAETMRCALPVLTSAGVPATIFVATGHIASQRPFWWDEVRRLLPSVSDGPLRLSAEGETRAWARPAAVADHVIAWLQPKRPEVIDGVVSQVRARVRHDQGMLVEQRPLTVDELRSVSASPAISVGAHTRTHPNLRFVDAARRMDELVGSREDLARWLDVAPPRGVAYPFGIAGADVDDATRAAAKEAGFEYAMLSSSGTLAAADRFALPRLAPPDVGADAFAALIKCPPSMRARRPGR